MPDYIMFKLKMLCERIDTMLKRRITGLLILTLTSIGISFNTNAYDVEKVVDVTNQYMEYTGRNNSNVFIVHENGENLYFKECIFKLEIHEYVKNLLHAYVSGDICKVSLTAEDEAILNSILSNQDNFDKFINMGAADKKGHPLTQYFKSKDRSVIGLDGKLSKSLERELPGLLKYMSRSLIQYHNNNVKVGELQDRVITRGLATTRIANILGLSNVVVDSKYTILKCVGCPDRFGIIMEPAKGVSYDVVKKMSNKGITGDFQRQINDLQVLDAVCRQVSHTIHNYFVGVSKENIIESIQAFDHDKSFSCDTNLKQQVASTQGIINGNGEIVIPYLSKSTADKILNLKEEDVKQVLSEILNEEEINATNIRINILKEAIKKTIKSRPKFLLNHNEWGTDTLKEQLSGKYGNTYLNIFCNAVNIEM